MKLLNWSKPWHWAYESKQCRYCGGATFLRDGKGSPAHKVCAEQALEQQAAQAAEDRARGLI